MKLPHWIPWLLIACTLALAGCGKSDQSAAAGTANALDATKFRPAFASASPEIKTIVDNVMMAIQASIYKDALAGLDKLAARPDLSEPQQKVVADLTEQVKKKMATLTP